MLQSIKYSTDYSNLLKNVIENELDITSQVSSNKILWIAMGNELEILGVEKTQISTIMRKDIEDLLYEKQFKDFMSREDYKWHNGSYWLVTKDNGWTNPDMARRTNIPDPTKDQLYCSIYTRNRRMMLLCDELIHICRVIKDKSKDKGTPVFEDVFGIGHMREFYMQRMTAIDNCRNAIDNKTKVPKNTELFLLECLATVLGNTNKCAEVFMQKNLIRLKEQGKFFTLKQASKFQKGGKQSQLDVLKPSSRDTSLYLDYIGVQCTCGGWRVRNRLGSNSELECYDCKRVFSKVHISKCMHCQIPLYKERLLWMVNHNNKCHNCEIENDLPDELIRFARS